MQVTGSHLHPRGIVLYCAFPPVCPAGAGGSIIPRGCKGPGVICVPAGLCYTPRGECRDFTTWGFPLGAFHLWGFPLGGKALWGFPLGAFHPVGISPRGILPRGVFPTGGKAYTPGGMPRGGSARGLPLANRFLLACGPYNIACPAGLPLGS